MVEYDHEGRNKDFDPDVYRIDGMGKDVEREVTKTGGEHAAVPYRFDLIPPEAMFALAKVLHEGIVSGYTKDNWRKIDCNTHLNHALSHIFAHMAGDSQDDHLEHALTRVAMAVTVNKKENNDARG